MQVCLNHSRYSADMATDFVKEQYEGIYNSYGIDNLLAGDSQMNPAAYKALSNSRV